MKDIITAVLFDMDGLVLDTEKLYTRFWQEAAITCGYPMTKEQALGMRSLNRGAGLAKMQGQYGSDYPSMMASAVLAVIPMIVIYIIFQKQFVEGIATSGGKL